jgi:hypothetical protein
MTSTISAPKVRYFKLGRAGEWEKECIKDGIIRFGFNTGTPARFRLCVARKWDSLKAAFARDGNDLSRAGTFTNQAKAFFEDNGSTLWVTFHGTRMYWGFLEATPPKPFDNGSTWRTVADGWSCCNLRGRQLTKPRLSTALTNYAMFPGTSCSLKKVAKSIIQVINGGA